MIIRIILLLAANIQPLEVQNFLASKGLKANVQFIRLGDPLIYGTQAEYFNRLVAAFNYTGHKIVLTNPFMQGSKEWMLGFTQKNFSHCVFNFENDRREPRYTQSLICILHELGHQCGLGHTQGCISITDEAALACPNIDTLGFLPNELRKLNRCK